MSKVILTTEFVEQLGALFGEDFTRRGTEPFLVEDSKGLFVEAFMDITNAEYFDDNCEYISVEGYNAIDFFKPKEVTE